MSMAARSWLHRDVRCRAATRASSSRVSARSRDFSSVNLRKKGVKTDGGFGSHLFFEVNHDLPAIKCLRDVDVTANDLAGILNSLLSSQKF